MGMTRAMNSRSILLSLTLWLCMATASAAEDLAPPSPAAGPQTLTVLFENDLFGDTDQQYTNGFKLNWISPN